MLTCLCSGPSFFDFTSGSADTAYSVPAPTWKVSLKHPLPYCQAELVCGDAFKLACSFRLVIHLDDLSLGEKEKARLAETGSSWRRELHSHQVQPSRAQASHGM